MIKNRWEASYVNSLRKYSFDRIRYLTESNLMSNRWEHMKISSGNILVMTRRVILIKKLETSREKMKTFDLILQKYQKPFLK